jgi:hypothetical protein
MYTIALITGSGAFKVGCSHTSNAADTNERFSKFASSVNLGSLEKCHNQKIDIVVENL